MSHDDVLLRAFNGSSNERTENVSSFFQRFFPVVNSPNGYIPTNVEATPFYRQPIYYKDSTVTDDAYLFGYLLLIFSFLSFAFVFYTIIFAKFMPDSNFKVG